MNPNIFNKNIVLLSLIFMGFYQGYAQNENTQGTSSAIVRSSPIETLQSVSETQMNTLSSNENSVFIRQIGASNTASATIYGKNKAVDLIQNGYENGAKVNLAGETVTHSLIQNGNNNLFLEYGNSPNLNLDRKIIQDGNNQGIVIFGSNALTDKLILNQQGNSKTITIRNFN